MEITATGNPTLPLSTTSWPGATAGPGTCQWQPLHELPLKEGLGLAPLVPSEPGPGTTWPSDTLVPSQWPITTVFGFCGIEATSASMMERHITGQVATLDVWRCPLQEGGCQPLSGRTREETGHSPCSKEVQLQACKNHWQISEAMSVEILHLSLSRPPWFSDLLLHWGYSAIDEPSMNRDGNPPMTFWSYLWSMKDLTPPWLLK